MKKGFSLFLTLVMLLTLLPTAAFALEEAEEAPAEEAAVQIQEQQKPEAEPQPDFGPDLFFEELAEEPLLLDAGTGTGTVKGTVSLPSGCTAQADSYLYVNLYTPPVLDKNGQVLNPAAGVQGTQVKIAQGARSASYSISNVAAGNYIIRVYSYVSHPGTLGGESFYSGDGTQAANVYAATPMTVSSGSTKTVNLTLPAASRSISGTLTFDTAASEDTEIRLHASNNRQGDRSYYSSRVTLKKGSKSVDFAIGVTPDVYSLEFANDLTDAYVYCGLDGTLTTEWQQRMLFDTRTSSVSGLEENGSLLLGGISGQLRVTVNLPAALTEGRQYCVWALSEGGDNYSNYSTYIDAGSSSFTSPMALYLSDGEPFYVGYSDVTDADTWSASSTDMRYAAEGGITTVFARAKEFTVGEDTEVTITEPACYTVTGTLKRTANLSSTIAAYAFAEFGDGERYAARALFAAGAETASYTIYVPQSQKGNTFGMYAGPAKSPTGMQVDETLLQEGPSGTLTRNMTMGAITLLNREPTIRGTFSLPSGFTAPEGGLEVTLGIMADQNGYQEQEAYATYYMPAGTSSFSYGLCVPLSGGSVEVYAELDRLTDGLYYYVQDAFNASELAAADLVMPESVTISGTVSVPESCRDGAATVQISAADEDYFYNNYFYVLIPTGEISTTYAFQMPKGVSLNWVYARVQGDTLGVLSDRNLYLQEDGSTGTTNPSFSLVLEEDLVVNFPISRAAYLTGTVSLAPGMPAGYYEGTVRVKNISTNRSYNQYIEFTGTSTEYKISLPAEAAQYQVSLYMYTGVGTILYTYYYYSESGMTADSSAATPVSVSAEGGTLDLTIPKAKLISGRFVASDGDSITWNSENNQYFYLIPTAGGSNVSCSASVDAQGNWTMTVDPTLTGDYYLRTYVSSDSQSNIVNAEYYYSTGSEVVTNKTNASAITIGTEDISGLNLLANTGWVLSGSILYAAGSYLSLGDYDFLSLSLSASGDAAGYSSSSCRITANGGTYSIVVPKKADTYTIRTNSPSLDSGMSTNLYFANQTLSDISISGNTSGLDLTIPVTDTVINGTIYRPDGISDYINIRLTLRTRNSSGNTYYDSSAYMYAKDDSVTFCIPIDPNETSETYQFEYYIYDTVDGIVSGGYTHTVYLCEDGTLTTDQNQAGRLSLVTDQDISFTLLTAEPFASGRIYCPEGLTNDVEVYVDYTVVGQLSTADHSDTGTYVWVGPNYGQLDSEGNRYSTYSLAGTEVSAGDTYRLSYAVEYNGGQTSVDTNTHYLNSFGELTTSVSEDSLFTVPASGSNTVDFPLLLWEDGADTALFQSAHGITLSDGQLTYTYTYPGNADSLTATFSPRTDVNLTINGKIYYTSDLLMDPTVEVSGNTLTITFTAPSNAQKYFGFAVESITANGSTLTSPGAAAVYTASGSSDAAVLSGLKEGQPVRVTLVGTDTITTETSLVTGVLYDKDGRMLDVVQVPVDSNGETDTAALIFDEYGDAVTLKILLIDSNGTPLMENLTLANQ